MAQYLVELGSPSIPIT